MIKYFCDICEKEIEKSEKYTYTLPLYCADQLMTSFGETICTIDRIKDLEIEICSNCRYKISMFLKDMK